MLIVQILSWGMIIASSLRYTLSTSMEANEVIGLSMDNIWRSTQLFYISAPLLLYSIIKGIQDYMRYQMYGEDISYWVGGDRGVMSKNLVKYWTLLLIMGAIGAWLYYLIEGRKHMGVLSAVIIVTLTLGVAFSILQPHKKKHLRITVVHLTLYFSFSWGRHL
jgi:heme/copper-type cytochrome/quinol oxidase subunit 3